MITSRFFHTLGLTFTLCFSAYGSPLKTLGEKEREQVEQGEITIIEEPQETGPWPHVTAYLKLNTEPAQAMAIFAAYDHQKNYVPNVLESTPIAQANPMETRVQYRLHMPWPLSDARYIHDHRLSLRQDSEETPPTYRLDWWMVESSSTDFVEGYVEFVPLEEQKTLMIYHNKVRPKSALARLFRGAMIRDLTETLVAIKEEIHEHQNPQKSKLGGTYREKLERSLEGNLVWKKNNSIDFL